MVISQQDFSESRRSARRAVDFCCDLVTTSWDRPVASECTDLSPFGMWLETTLPVVEGDQVVVGFTPPNRKQEMTLFAQVRHAEPIAIEERVHEVSDLAFVFAVFRGVEHEFDEGKRLAALALQQMLDGLKVGAHREALLVVMNGHENWQMQRLCRPARFRSEKTRPFVFGRLRAPHAQPLAALRGVGSRESVTPARLSTRARRLPLVHGTLGGGPGRSKARDARRAGC